MLYDPLRTGLLNPGHCATWGIATGSGRVMVQPDQGLSTAGRRQCLLRFLKWAPLNALRAKGQAMDALPLWLENAVHAAGMTAYADFDFVGNKSETEKSEQQHVADPPGNVH